MHESEWKRCEEFHGHGCPGLATGCRAAVEACRFFGIPLEKVRDEELVCVTESDACGIDAIQCLLSCTPGKGNMVMRLRGKHAYSFFDRRSGKSVRLVPKFDRSKDREELIRFILDAPAEEVFDFKVPPYNVPEKAKIFDSGRCACCGEYVREDLLRLKGGSTYCLDCFSEYSSRWD